MSFEVDRKVVLEPVYYHREYENDLGKKVEEPSWAQQCQRAALVALPFFSLCKPLSLPISLGMGALRTWTNASQLFESIQRGDSKEIPYQLLQTTIAVVALAGTIFAHPLGMLISTGHDLIIDIVHLADHLEKGEYQKALESCANILNNSLYLALFLHGGLELTIASLAMQIMLGIYHSHEEFQKGNYLEASGHLLMAMIRGNQMAEQVKLQQKKWEIEELLNKSRKQERSGLSLKISSTRNSQQQEKTKIPVVSKLKVQRAAHGADQGYINVLMQYGSIVNAANEQDIPAVELFLKNGANPNERSTLGSAEYKWGTRHGHNTEINEGMTSLDVAAKTRNIELAKLLLRYGASPSLFRRVDFNLHIIPSYRDKKLDEPHIGYITPIYVALKTENYELLQAFRDYRCDFNKACFYYRQGFPTKEGLTPLNIAITDRDVKAVEILVRGGAKP